MQKDRHLAVLANDIKFSDMLTFTLTWHLEHQMSCCFTKHAKVQQFMPRYSTDEGNNHIFLLIKPLCTHLI